MEGIENYNRWELSCCIGQQNDTTPGQIELKELVSDVAAQIYIVVVEVGGMLLNGF